MRALRVAPIVAAAVLAAGAARAQDPLAGLALDQLSPTPPGDAFFGVPSPFIGGHLVPRGALLWSYAHRPLVLDNGTDADAVVGAQGILHLAGSFAIWDRLQASLHFPLALFQRGDSPTLGRTTYPSPSSVQAGDLRLGLRVRLFGEETDAVQAAIGLYLHFPTGPRPSYMGDGAVRDAPHLSFGGRVNDLLVWSAAIGATIHAAASPSTFDFGGGVAMRLLEDRLQVGPEAFVAMELPSGLTEKQVDRWSGDVAFNAEVLLGARARIVEGLVAGLAVGPGLTDAVGTPAFRIIGTVGWSPAPESTAASTAPTGDTDADGVPDTIDPCPYAYGEKGPDPRRAGCPTDEAPSP